MTRQGGASLAAYKFGGKVYPYRTAPRCQTCQSPRRMEIEQMIAHGVSYTRIANDLELPQTGQGRVTVKSLRNHFERGHMPVQAESVRRVLESRAEARGMGVDGEIQKAVDAQGFAEIVLQDTVRRIASGDLKPEISHGMDAAKLLALVSPHEQASNEQDYVTAFMVYHALVQEIMTAAQFAEFGAQISRNPVLAALLAKYEDPETSDNDDFYSVPAALEEADVEDAVIIEDEDDED